MNGEHSGRETWEGSHEFDESRGLYLTPAEIEANRLDAENAARQIERAARAQREREAREAAIIGASCARCGRTNVAKHDGKHCTYCEGVVALRNVIEAFGGMGQTADSLAEKLYDANVGFVEEW